GFNTFSSCWWNGCCQPWGWPLWWWPSYVYVPTYVYETPPSQVVVEQQPPPAQPAEPQPAEGGHVAHEMTPAELAKKYVDLGDFYFRANRFADSADAYSRARTYAPNDATIHFALADAVFATGDYHFAAYLIAEALRIDPAMSSVDADKRLLYGDVK